MCGCHFLFIHQTGQCHGCHATTTTFFARNNGYFPPLPPTTTSSSAEDQPTAHGSTFASSCPKNSYRISSSIISPRDDTVSLFIYLFMISYVSVSTNTCRRRRPLVLLRAPCSILRAAPSLTSVPMNNLCRYARCVDRQIHMLSTLTHCSFSARLPPPLFRSTPLHMTDVSP